LEPPIRSFFVLGIFLISFATHATKTTGRLTLGVASSTERFNSTDFGSDKNDTFFSSQRIFYRVSEMGDDQWELLTDLRNKYDSFDKLNKEQYQLDPRDEFQIRQFSLRMVNPNGSFVPTIGRFQVSEAGAVFVDGLNFQYRFATDWSAGIFGGLNPKQVDKAFFVSDSKATQAGAFLTYQRKADGWDTNEYLTHGFIQQKYNTETERQFLFQNFIYQWAEDSRIISLLYLDFVPRTFVQTINLIYQQSFSRNFSTELGLLGIDVIEYQRRQNVLERLSPSPYKEAHLGFDFKTTRDSTLSLTASSGERSSDQLKRTDLSLGYRLQNFITRNWDAQLKLTGRKNFTSQDSLVGFSLGYFSKAYEVVVDLDYGIQKNDDGVTTHPQTSEISLTSFFSKEIFATAAFERSADENVTILGTFIKLGYRFGNQELPPIRDGAAPRGSL
jgi:hypothetical protein